MSEIIKTEAVVLSKLNYGDTSSIVTLYTREQGKISVIIKGARRPSSKIGLLFDPVNHLQVILYSKATRDVQLVSNADLLNHFPHIREELDKLKYAYAVLELVKKLTPDHETNDKLFRGIIRILCLLDSSNEAPIINFLKFFLFFLTETGYQLQLKSCVSCGAEIINGTNVFYSMNKGLLCANCKNSFLDAALLKPELFELLKCLMRNEIRITANSELTSAALDFLEKYLKFHAADFGSIQSLKLF
jgi:DNA repair protein RecO (recombination protein O)